jgi:hypothetical protein
MSYATATSSSLGRCGGERGIRTLDGLLTHTPLAGVRLRPLGHLSGADLPIPIFEACSFERGIIPHIHVLYPVGAACSLALLSDQAFASTREPSGDAGVLAKAGKNTGGNPLRKGRRVNESRTARRLKENRGAGYCGRSAVRCIERLAQDPAPVSGRFAAPPAACSSRLMRS